MRLRQSPAGRYNCRVSNPHRFHHVEGQTRSIAIDGSIALHVLDELQTGDSTPAADVTSLNVLSPLLRKSVFRSKFVT